MRLFAEPTVRLNADRSTTATATASTAANASTTQWEVVSGGGDGQSLSIPHRSHVLVVVMASWVFLCCGCTVYAFCALRAFNRMPATKVSLSGTTINTAGRSPNMTRLTVNPLSPMNGLAFYSEIAPIPQHQEVDSQCIAGQINESSNLLKYSVSTTDIRDSLQCIADDAVGAELSDDSDVVPKI